MLDRYGRPWKQRQRQHYTPQELDTTLHNATKSDMTSSDECRRVAEVRGSKSLNLAERRPSAEGLGGPRPISLVCVLCVSCVCVVCLLCASAQAFPFEAHDEVLVKRGIVARGVHPVSSDNSMYVPEHSTRISSVASSPPEPLTVLWLDGIEGHPLLDTRAPPSIALGP